MKTTSTLQKIEWRKQMFKILLISSTALLFACSDEYRNSVQQHVEDMEVCRKANMSAYLNGVGEVKCSPKGDEYQNFKR